MAPNVPFSDEPTDPLALPAVPATTPITVPVSPESTSISLLSTFPVGLVPANPLETPPASMAVVISTVAVGASLFPRTVTTICAVENAPPVSWSVYVKVSVSV